MEKKNLPSLQDLYQGQIAQIHKENQLNVLLNQNPKPEWIKKHPTAKDVKYISIARVEFLLTSIFIDWHVEIKNVQMIANSAVVTIRLHYRHPVTQEMAYQDGVGGAPIHTKKGAGATDFSQVNSDSVMKAVPAAESFAIKDAAHKLGNLFGADLNRPDEIIYDGLVDRFDLSSQLQKILSKKIAQCTDEKIQSEVMDKVLKAEEENTNDEKFYQEILKEYFGYEN